MSADAANYTAEKLTVDGMEIVRLADAAHKTEVSIVPSVGNTAYEMKVNGKPVFWSPYQSVKQFKDKPVHLGIPFLAPWANRIDGDVYWANGKQYHLNPDLKNFSYDGHRKPIHGLVTFTPDWKVISAKADGNSAETTSRLEFWRNPGWMAQFPFAQNIYMTHRLKDGVLEVETVIENLSTDPLPVALGYHPYFTITDAPRDQWKVHLAAREHFTTTNELIPNGTEPVKYSDPQPLQGVTFDDGFTNLTRGGDGRAEFWVQGASQKISVVYGPKYQVAVVYAPPGRNFVCFEPMTAPTNGFNMAHDGRFSTLESVAPGSKWQESFWIKPSGF
jgi:aldose 1-epimerase